MCNLASMPGEDERPPQGYVYSVFKNIISVLYASISSDIINTQGVNVYLAL